VTPDRRLMCREVVDLLAEYVGRALDAGDVRALERHLEDCAPCRAYLATYRKTIGLTGRAMNVEMPDELKRRLREFVARRGRDASR
jgi:anti-sigma factor RsiW